MEKKVIVSVFESLDHAKEVVWDLQSEGCDRSDIGLAVSESHNPANQDMFGGVSGKALVTVRVPEYDVEQIQQLIEAHNPESLDVRDEQWRMNGETHVEPDETKFTAVEIEEKHIQPKS